MKIDTQVALLEAALKEVGNPDIHIKFGYGKVNLLWRDGHLFTVNKSDTVENPMTTIPPDEILSILADKLLDMLRFIHEDLKSKVSNAAAVLRAVDEWFRE
jgi:hypothetical protein